MHLNDKLATAEKLLNFTGYILPTGSFRVTLGTVQLCAFGMLGIMTAMERHFLQMKRKEPLLYYCIEQSVHGLFNVIRGIIESLPFFIGTMVCLAYDLAGNRVTYLGENTEFLRIQLLLS